MIFEAIITVLAGLASFIGSLFPEIQVPAFVDSVAGLVATVAGAMAPLGTWIPFGPAGNATAFVLLAIGVALLIRVVRMLVSVFTGGGGS